MKITIECEVCKTKKTFEGDYTVSPEEQDPFSIFTSDDENPVIECDVCQRRIKFESY